MLQIYKKIQEMVVQLQPFLRNLFSFSEIYNKNPNYSTHLSYHQDGKYGISITTGTSSPLKQSVPALICAGTGCFG